MPVEQLKVGQKVYESIGYFSDRFGLNSERTGMTQLVIKELKRGRVYFKGMSWSFRVEQLGDEFFLSKADAIKAAIEGHERHLDRVMDEQVRPMQKEISALKRMLKRRENGVD